MKATDWQNCPIPKNMSKTELRGILTLQGRSLEGSNRQNMIDNVTDTMINELRNLNGNNIKALELLQKSKEESDRLKIELEQHLKMESEKKTVEHISVENGLKAELELVKQQSVIDKAELEALQRSKGESDRVMVELKQRSAENEKLIADHLSTESALKTELERVKQQSVIDKAEFETLQKSKEELEQLKVELELQKMENEKLTANSLLLFENELKAELERVKEEDLVKFIGSRALIKIVTEDSQPVTGLNNLLTKQNVSMIETIQDQDHDDGSPWAIIPNADYSFVSIHSKSLAVSGEIDLLDDKDVDQP